MKTAFQFSGGKDSTAALYFVKAQWQDLHFYTLDSGDMFPETKAFVKMVAEELPNHTWVQGAQEQSIHDFGPPSDLIPFGSSDEAHLLKVGSSPLLQNRLLCCLRSKMIPMHMRMLADDITHIMRGQRREEEFKGPMTDKTSDGRFTVLYPIEDWTEHQVWAYLDEVDRVPPLYRYDIKRSGDCMACSAWLGDSRPQYLRRHHPEKSAILQHRLTIIDQAVDKDIGYLERARHDKG